LAYESLTPPRFIRPPAPAGVKKAGRFAFVQTAPLWYNVRALAVQREEMIMAKTAVISARIDPALKRNAERIFGELGLTTSQAITLFYRQVDLQRGLPFSVKIPNEVTKKALEDAKARRNLESFDSIDDLYEDLGI
jgi:DNA-damage-inducible protein J